MSRKGLSPGLMSGVEPELATRISFTKSKEQKEPLGQTLRSLPESSRMNCFSCQKKKWDILIDLKIFLGTKEVGVGEEELNVLVKVGNIGPS